MHFDQLKKKKKKKVVSEINASGCVPLTLTDWLALPLPWPATNVSVLVWVSAEA